MTGKRKEVYKEQQQSIIEPAFRREGSNYFANYGGFVAVISFLEVLRFLFRTRRQSLRIIRFDLSRLWQ